MAIVKSNDYPPDTKQNMFLLWFQTLRKQESWGILFVTFELIKQQSKQYHKGWTKKHFVCRTYPTQLEWILPPAAVMECVFSQRHQVYRPWKNPEGYHIANTKMCEKKVLWVLILFAINKTRLNKHMSIHEIFIPWTL